MISPAGLKILASLSAITELEVKAHRAACLARAADPNNNPQSVVSEVLFQAANLPFAGDFDANDGSKAAENRAGTDPKSAASHPGSEMVLVAQMPTFGWVGLKGKYYGLLSSSNLTLFSPTADFATACRAERRKKAREIDKQPCPKDLLRDG